MNVRHIGNCTSGNMVHVSTKQGFVLDKPSFIKHATCEACILIRFQKEAENDE